MPWKASRPSLPKGRYNGRIGEQSDHRWNCRTGERAVRGPVVQGRARMESRRAWSQGGRLYADLRPARDHSRCGNAFSRHRRRRRPARGDPRRRLLSELYLPNPPFDDRARRIGSPRFRRWHAVPVDLRRHSQPVRHVADDVSGASMSATSTFHRITATTSAATIMSTSSPSCGTAWPSSAAHRSPTRSLRLRSPSTTRTGV